MSCRPMDAFGLFVEQPLAPAVTTEDGPFLRASTFAGCQVIPYFCSSLLVEVN